MLLGRITKMKSYKSIILNAIAPTIVVSAVFAITYKWFGFENTMIAPFVALTFLKFRSMNLNYGCMLKNYAIFVFMTICAYVCTSNVVLCAIVNAIALFLLGYLFIDEYNPTNYFPAGMALIFFQIAPAMEFSALVNRLAALTVSFAVVVVAAVVLAVFGRKNDIRDIVAQGFEITNIMIEAAERGDDVTELSSRLCGVDRQLVSQIYSYNRAAIFGKSRINHYCRHLILFQIINYMLTNDRALLPKAKALYQEHSERFKVVPERKYRPMSFRDYNLDLKSVRTRFALRMMVVVVPCFVYAQASGFENAYWLVISVFFMMVPFADDTKKRVLERLAGTVAGIMLCSIAFTIFTDMGSRLVIMTIANFMIYCSSSYWTTVTYITLSALSIQTIGSNTAMVLGERLMYTLLGAAIVLIVNRYVFPIRIQYQEEYLLELISRLQREMLEITKTYEPGDGTRRRELDRRAVKIYMLFKRIEALYTSHPELYANEDYKKLEYENVGFLVDTLAEYMM